MNKNQSSKNLRGFLINQVIVNTIFNAALNATIPYFVLRSYTTVHLYIGEQPFAKNIVPLFFILPLVLTIIWCIRRQKK